MSKEVNIAEISNEIKELLCLPKSQNVDNISVIPLQDYIKAVEEQDKAISNFFAYEMMRLLIFRSLMCLKSNNIGSFAVVLFHSQNRESSDSKDSIIISRLDYPISINEKNFCYNPDDGACRVPQSAIKEWFEDNPELIYSTTKEMLIENGYNTEYEFKEALIKHIRLRGYRYDGFVVGWLNSVVDKTRMYIRL
jgi:hypothetical protein